MYYNYLLDRLDELRRVIRKLEWVDDYLIFLQSIKEIEVSSYEQEIEHATDNKKMGFALTLKSKSGKLKDYRSSFSGIDEIPHLKPPLTGSGVPENFGQLSQPHTSSIRGDFSNSVDMKQNPHEDILKIAFDEATEYQIPLLHSAKVSIENRVIASPHDKPLVENSLRCDYQVSTKFFIHGTSYNLSRSIAGRSVNLNIGEILKNLVTASISRFKYKPMKFVDDPIILLHPDIIGGILCNYFAHFPNENFDDEPIWDPNYQIYDDPLRAGGYYSYLFDDEGSQTGAIQLIEDGLVKHQLSRAQSEGVGGNGYRIAFFQAKKRSYSYPSSNSVSNLVVTGGTGLGQYFKELPGELLLIRKGYVYPGITAGRGDFILHVSEAEVWNSGELVGPISNLTISGNLEEIMKTGQMSSDLQMVVDQTFPFSIYTGWISIPPSLVSIRS